MKEVRRMKWIVPLLIVLMASVVSAQNYCVGVGTENPRFKFDVAGTFRAQGLAAFESDVDVEGRLFVGGKKVCLEDGTNCPAGGGAGGGLWSSGVDSAGEDSYAGWTGATINEDDTCDGDKDEEYTCAPSDSKDCVDVKIKADLSSYEKRALECKTIVSTSEFISVGGLCTGDSCSEALHVPGGLYGHCSEKGGQWGGSQCSALAPASCEGQYEHSKNCECPAGYRKVTTGQYKFGCGDGDTCYDRWYSCYKQ